MISLRYTLALGVLLSAFLCTSCGIFSGLVRPLETREPNIVVPDAWMTRLDSSDDAHRWVARFGDRNLAHIVQLALKHNEDLQIAAENIKTLKNAELISSARHKPNLTSSFGTSSSGRINDGEGSESNSFNLSLSSRWETDLWGRLADQEKRAKLNTSAAKADLFAARLSIAGSTAKAWFSLIAAQNTLQLREETLINYQNSLRIIERNYKAGVPGVDALDVRFGRNNITSVSRQISQAKLRVAQSAQALEIILGRYPSGTLRAGNVLPDPIQSLPSVLPEGVLEQRPDLLAARTRLQARVKDIDIAQKALLPNISLSGSTSDNSVSLSRLVDVSYLSWRVASALSYTLYDNGSREAEIAQALSDHEVAILNYTKDCRSAFREVEFALMAERALETQSELLREEVKVASLAERQAQREYSEGLENVRILSVLEAQRRAVNARFSQISILNNRLENQVDLFIAMGGNP